MHAIIRSLRARISPLPHLTMCSSSSSSSSLLFLRSLSSSGMSAQVITAAHATNYQMSLEQLVKPKPKRGEVLLRVAGCGVCHTDLHIMKNEIPFPLPAVLGHEASGIVEEIGEGGAGSYDIKVGSRVVAPFIMPCTSCNYCKQGREELCEPFFALNRGKGALYDGETRLYRPNGERISMYSMGGLAEYCVVPLSSVFTLPQHIPLQSAAILGCALFTAYGAIVNQAQLRSDETLAVVGSGGIGSNVLQIARSIKVKQRIAVDVDDKKLEKMLAMGATHIINARKENVVDRIRALTNDKGVDVCIEAIGHPATFAQSVQAVKDGGRAVMVGIAPMGVKGEVEITRLVRRQIRVLGSFGARPTVDMPPLIDMVARGDIDLEQAITRRYDLKSAGEAYKALDKGEVTGRAIIQVS